MTSAGTSLRVVKLEHTIVWAIFASSILAIPVLAWLDFDRQATALILLVLVEVLVLGRRDASHSDFFGFEQGSCTSRGAVPARTGFRARCSAAIA